MEVGLISKELIKPSSQTIRNLEPFKISLIDQIVPTTYFPVILFYPTNNSHFKHAQISTQLKTSLVETLSVFYPLYGRLKDNLVVENYETGIPYTETRVKGSLFDFVQRPQLELLNQFLPCLPCRCQPDPEAAPQVAVQMNIFDCGGIAVGLCASHKFIDGFTASTVLHAWTANARRSVDKETIKLDFSETSTRFPPSKWSSQIYSSMMEKLVFSEGKYVTKRFVFQDKAIATLRENATGKHINTATRYEAVSSFIWKSAMEAAKSLSNSSKLSVALHCVDVRGRIKPRFPSHAIGNIWVLAIAKCNMADSNMGLHEFAALTNKAISEINVDYLGTFQGDKGSEAATNYINRLIGLHFKKPEMFTFTSWLRFGFHELDFGWGKPIWAGVLGGVGSAFTNLTILKETGFTNDVEAWVTFDENILAVMENDPEFLAFATPNPGISIPLHLI